MAETIKQDEAIPASYPATPSGLSTEAATINPAIIWARIEHYIAHRFSARSIVWVAEGEGYWLPPLSPATVSATEIWNGTAWETVTLSPSPLGGYVLPGCGPYRFTASVGGGAVPAGVNEAYRRLAEYLAASSTSPGVRQENVDGIGSIEYDLSGVARAMERSGAGDLLRPYRRAA